MTPSTGWANRLGQQVALVPPDQLLAHPLNARRHPGAQRDALRAALSAIGWVAPVTVREEERLAAAVTEEERAAARRDTAVFRISLTYAGEEAEVVKAALGAHPASGLLELCRAATPRP